MVQQGVADLQGGNDLGCIDSLALRMKWLHLCSPIKKKWPSRDNDDDGNENVKKKKKQ